MTKIDIDKFVSVLMIESQSSVAQKWYKNTLLDQGLRWNEESKCIEDIKPKEISPKFKAGDNVIHKKSGIKYRIDSVHEDHYMTHYPTTSLIPFENQDDFMLAYNMTDFEKEMLPLMKDLVYKGSFGNPTEADLIEMLRKKENRLFSIIRKQILCEDGGASKFDRDYIITIQSDFNDSAYWSLMRKGENVLANRKELEMISDIIGKMKQKIDENLNMEG